MERNIEFDRLIAKYRWFNYQPFYDQVSNLNGEVFVEVGVWRGQSIAYLVQQLVAKEKPFKKVYAVDLFEQTPDPAILEKLEPNEQGRLWDIYDYYLRREGVRKYISDIHGDSAESANCFEDESVDFVFIDASHYYETCKGDIEAWMPKVKPGGVISGHDYDAGWPGVTQAVNEKIGANRVNKAAGSVWFYQLPPLQN